MKLPQNKLILYAIFAIAFLALLGGAAFFFLSQRGEPDTKSPELHLTNLSEDDWLSTNEDKVTLKGLVADESDVKEIKWETQAGTSGKANVSGGEWTIEDIPLEQGDNTVTITATDSGGNTSTATVNVVYNPNFLFTDLTLSQDFIYKDDFPTQITAAGSVQTDVKNGIDKVFLYKFEGGQFTKLTEMLDNGVVANGDDIPGDTIFSGIDSFSSTTNDTIQLRVGATAKGDKTTYYSGVLEIQVFDKPSQESINTIFDLNEEFNSRFEELSQSGDQQQAAQLLAEELNQRDEIEIAGVSEEGFGVWWLYAESGILAGIENNPEGTRAEKNAQPEQKRKRARERERQSQADQGSVQGIADVVSPIHFGVSQARAQEPKPKTEVKSTKAIYLGPYLHQFGDTDDYHKGWQVIKNNKCPECQTTEKKDKEVKVDDFKTLSQYGLIVVPSHGDTWFNGKFADYCKTDGDCPEALKNGGGYVNIFVDHVVDENSVINYLPDLLRWRLAFDASDNTLAVLPPYITAYNGTFPNSVVYIGTCRSSHNFTMAGAFISKGAKAYFGFTDYVGWDYAGDVTEEMFKSFMQKGKSAKESFDDAVAAHGTSDADSDPAFFSFVGSPDLVMGGRDIQNGSFEEGLVGWQAEGDSRVINRLAGLTPRDGDKMGIISTGLGSVNQSNSALIQKICVTKGKLTLSFNYNVISEEPLEYFGSIYDDNFTMTITVNGKKTTVARNTINNSKWKKISGINFAGGDNTTFHTGWKTIVKDLGEVQEDDKVQIEFRVSDKGDSIYDTATIIDAVKLEVK